MPWSLSFCSCDHMEFVFRRGCCFVCCFPGFWESTFLKYWGRGICFWGVISLLFFVLPIILPLLTIYWFLLPRKRILFHLTIIIVLGACSGIQFSQMVVDVTITYIILHSLLLLILLVSLPYFFFQCVSSWWVRFPFLSYLDALSAAAFFFFSSFFISPHPTCNVLRCLPLIFLSSLLSLLTMYQPLSSSSSPNLFLTYPHQTCSVMRCLPLLFLSDGVFVLLIYLPLYPFRFDSLMMMASCCKINGWSRLCWSRCGCFWLVWLKGCWK